MSLASIQNAVKTQESQQVLSLTSFFDCVSFEWCEQYLDEGITVGCQFFSKLFFSGILQSYHNFSKIPREEESFSEGHLELCKSYIEVKSRPFKVAVYIFKQIKALPNDFAIVFQWGYLIILKKLIINQEIQVAQWSMH